MTKKWKQPLLTTGRIKPHEIISENTDIQKPFFSLEHMIDNFCVKACKMEERAQFAEALYKRGKLTWQEIKQSHRHGLGLEKISRGSIKVGLPSVVTEDVNLIAFRCFGKMPMVGYRQGRTFYVLWLDPAGKVYDHGS